jgi:hypothetical protein
MKILAIETEVAGAPDEAFTPHLKAEQQGHGSSTRQEWFASSTSARTAPPRC